MHAIQAGDCFRVVVAYQCPWEGEPIHSTELAVVEPHVVAASTKRTNAPVACGYGTPEHHILKEAPAVVAT